MIAFSRPAGKAETDDGSTVEAIRAAILAFSTQAEDPNWANPIVSR